MTWAGYYFPHDEFYDASMRDVMTEIARRARQVRVWRARVRRWLLIMQGLRNARIWFVFRYRIRKR